MNVSQIFGLVILVVGIILLAFGINASQSVTEKVVEGVSGKYTEHTMWYIIGGIAMIVAGVALAFRNRCCKK